MEGAWTDPDDRNIKVDMNSAPKLKKLSKKNII